MEGEEGEAARKERLRACQDFKSLDETALLAVGVLMEEMMREGVGETGDLAFTQEVRRKRKVVKRVKRVKRAKEVEAVPDEEPAQADTEAPAEGRVVDSGKAEAQKQKDKKKRRKSTSKSGGRKSKKGKT